MSREFLLVHGMSHGGWAWDVLARRLELGDAVGARRAGEDLTSVAARAT